MPPKSATSLSKLDCSELSALPAAVEESPDVLDNEWTRPLRSDTGCEPGLEVPDEETELVSATRSERQVLAER